MCGLHCCIVLTWLRSAPDTTAASLTLEGLSKGLKRPTLLHTTVTMLCENVMSCFHTLQGSLAYFGLFALIGAAGKMAFDAFAAK